MELKSLRTGTSILSTDELAEGAINLYFTNERAQDAIGSILQDTSSINFIYNDSGGIISAEVLPGGIDHNSLANLTVGDPHTQYHTDSRALTWLGTRSTSDLPEGSNLYFTDERVDDRVALLIQNGTGLSWSYNDGLNTLTGNVSLSAFSTTDLSEGSNLYFTDERAQDAIGSILQDSSTIDFTYNDSGGLITASVIASAIDHNSLANLTVGDVHTQYAYLAGRSGGQTLYGGSGAGENLTLISTNNATRGKIFFGTVGTNVYDGVNDRFGFGTASPLYKFDLRGTLTSTSGNDAVEFITAETSPSGASTAAHRAFDAIISYNTSNANNLTTLASGRFLAINNNSAGGTLTTLQGLALQCVVGAVLGAASGTAYAANINGAVFQSIQNSTTTSVTATNFAGQFSADHRGSNTVTNQSANVLTLAMTNASGTLTSGQSLWIRWSTIFGNSLTAGTITNIYGINIEGFPSGGSTFTNTPEQIRLQAGATACIALRQQGASNHSRFQGAVKIGADSTPTATYALDLAGNLTTSATVFNFTTLTSLTFQDALARTRLFMDATTTTINTVPVTIQPTANIGTGISLTTITPAHTGLSAEQQEVVIDMSSTKSWNASVTVPLQRSLYIKAPTLSGSVTSVFTQAAAVTISGVPTVASAAQVTTSIGFLLEQVAIPSGVSTGIGFLIYAPTTAGASTVSCGSFMDGNVGINTLTPGTWLDVKIVNLGSTANDITCIDGVTRYTGMYVGGTSITSAPGGGTSGFLLDFGWNSSINSSFGVSSNQILFNLEGSVNYTGSVQGNVISFNVNTSGGTLTQGTSLNAVFTTATGSTGAVTTARSARTGGTINGTGTVTTYVGLDQVFSTANVAVTVTDGYFIRLNSPTKGASATVTNWDSILLEDNTLTVGTRKSHIRALGTTTSRHVGMFKFGADAAPVVMADINGGLSINSSGSTVSLTADNQVVTVSDRSYIRLSSNNGTAGNRTFVLTQSTRDGHILVLEWTGTNAGELVDDSAQNGGGNHRLSATWTPTQYDTLTLISNGTDWVELARSAN